MYATNQFRKGLKIELDGVPFQIVDFQHVSPGKGGSFTRTKLRNLINQNVIERTFKSGDKVPPANSEDREMQFLYGGGDGFHFMDAKTYEQISVPQEVLGEQSGFLQENCIVKVTYINDRPTAVELPTFVELKVVDTEPSIRGDTVSGGSKPAKLEPGGTVTVPMHIKEGDLIRVDTRDASYVEKVNK